VVHVAIEELKRQVASKIHSLAPELYPGHDRVHLLPHIDFIS